MMGEKNNSEVGAIGIRLIDDAYMSWVAAEANCAEALRTWFDGGCRQDRSYYAYRAALDREEAAARDLERLWAVVEPYRAAFAGDGSQPARR
jgi:hypothetical protein